MGIFRNGQVCTNGHAITSAADKFPQLRETFCSRCGAPTITECPGCSTSIRGYYHSDGVIDATEWVPPRYCHSCGVPYPWTQARTAAAAAIVEEMDGLSGAEKEALKKSLAELINDAPTIEAASLRIKKLLLKVGQAGADALRNLLIDVLSETAKKSMGL